MYIQGKCRALEYIYKQCNYKREKWDMGEVNVGTELIFRATVIQPLPKAFEKTVGNIIKLISHAHWRY